MLKKIALYIFCSFSLSVFPQMEAIHWQFQNYGGIKYNWCTETYDIVTEGQAFVDNNQIQTGYSMSTISDKDGNLMFYSDGRSIWHRNHQPIPQASEYDDTQIQGKGNVIILPQPNNPNIYYVFALDNGAFWNTYPDAPGPVTDDDGINNGFTYSVIDTTLNGGLGDIIPGLKDIPLLTYNPNDTIEEAIKCSRKLTVVRGNDCNSYWIITHFRASFYAFKFDENGLDNNPVVSTVAPLIEPQEITNSNSIWYRGAKFFKSSPDGSKLAISHAFKNDVFGEPGFIYVYDFNNSNGNVSNTTPVFLGVDDNEYPAAIEFSPSGNYLYGFTYDFLVNNDGGFDSNRFLRWNLQATNISESVEIIDESLAYDNANIQLGIDNKIYLNNNASGSELLGQASRYLAVINNPDATLPNINLQADGILVDPSTIFENTARGPLPQLNNHWFNKRVEIIKNGLSKCELFICGTQSEFLTAENISGADYVWSKDGNVLAGENTFQLEIFEPGFYEVFIEPNDGRCPFFGNATVLQSNAVPSALDISIFQCDEDGISDGLTAFNITDLIEDITNNEADRSVAFYESFSNAQTQTFPIDGSNYNNTANPQTIYTVVTNTNSGCTAISEVMLHVSNTGVDNTFLSGCDDDSILDGIGSFDLSNASNTILSGLPNELTIAFYESYNNALIENNPLPNDYNNTTPYSQIIYARVEDGFNCYGISEVTLSIVLPPNIETEFETLYCLNSSPQTITLTGGIIDDNPSNYLYNWSTGETTSEIEVNDTGTYSVTVTNTDGCSKTRTITVLPSNTATIDNIIVTDASENNSITLQVSGEGDYEFALDNSVGPYQDSNVFENVSFGFHDVHVRDKNGCGIVSELVSVIGFPKFFTPNDDTVNDYWQVKGISAQFQPNSVIYIYDRYGKLLSQLDPLGPGWDGTFNGLPMPSTDYWFSVKLQDGRTFTGHFALRF
ncbi:T9SS type B sorting domain-containing protein [Ichthyenterobacterium sp. W332]|uniref:T9SS type B sorting domain-containing protein n=1 Tax=Microcosmobacter mediterraneus TaxID=3075607 RepID=A0ABU2YR22_9FLAO|nr:T9SS type B sorting domain-containing protein [Ichthyenterobacterium sp. W332]MDT0559528.1 T9SS type B sorting domain-containing protein [Ichthyenterobacterium sp. W332]